jgi:hypothetical protein
MVSKNWKLFVAHLSSFWLCEKLLGHTEQKMFPAKTKNGENKWAGPSTAWLGNPFGILRNSMNNQILDLFNSRIFIGFLFFRS